MRFATGTAAVGFATAAGAGGQGGVQQPAIVDELSDAGAEFAFGGREAGAGGDGLHVWYNNMISDMKVCQGLAANANLPASTADVKTLAKSNVSDA